MSASNPFYAYAREKGVNYGYVVTYVDMMRWSGIPRHSHDLDAIMGLTNKQQAEIEALWAAEQQRRLAVREAEFRRE